MVRSRGTFVHSAAVVAAVLCAFLCAPMARAASAHHLFDPPLSLTGSGETGASDEVRDPWCPGPPAPSGPFENPNIAVDLHGDMYVSSHKPFEGGGRIDVFGPTGKFITEIQA